MWRVYLQQHPRYGDWYRRVDRQPSWVVKAALTLAVLTVVIPLALLVMAAVLVGLVAFAALGLVAAVVQSFRGFFSPGAGGLSPRRPMDDGRRNVRVIRG